MIVLLVALVANLAYAEVCTANGRTAVAFCGYKKGEGTTVTMINGEDGVDCASMFAVSNDGTWAVCQGVNAADGADLPATEAFAAKQCRLRLGAKRIGCTAEKRTSAQEMRALWLAYNQEICIGKKRADKTQDEELCYWKANWSLECEGTRPCIAADTNQLTRPDEVKKMCGQASSVTQARTPCEGELRTGVSYCTHLAGEGAFVKAIEGVDGLECKDFFALGQTGRWGICQTGPANGKMDDKQCRLNLGSAYKDCTPAKKDLALKLNTEQWIPYNQQVCEGKYPCGEEMRFSVHSWGANADQTCEGSTHCMAIEAAPMKKPPKLSAKCNPAWVDNHAALCPAEDEGDKSEDDARAELKHNAEIAVAEVQDQRRDFPYEILAGIVLSAFAMGGIYQCRRKSVDMEARFQLLEEVDEL